MRGKCINVPRWAIDILAQITIFSSKTKSYKHTLRLEVGGNG
jgi:hypothetical protein